MDEPLNSLLSEIRNTSMSVKCGSLTAYNGLVLESIGPDSKIGDLCELLDDSGQVVCLLEVTGFRNNKLLLMPFDKISGISNNSTVRATGLRLSIPVGAELLGRVVDAFCRPIDGKGHIGLRDRYPIYRKPVNPFDRAEINAIVETGVGAIDALLTLGTGQRVGVFSGSGVGKSTLLGMICRNADADVIVLALIGERGREVSDFITNVLGLDGLQKSVVVAATSDQPALARTYAAQSAHAIAEYFSDQGKSVLLVVDSITRFAMAQREIGLAIGEPPTFRGYTPSVFSSLPPLLERCGNFKSGGSITAVYSVLVEGDDMNEPVADHMRSLLDGHIVLSRDLAARAHYPSIDILQSASRLFDKLAKADEQAIAKKVRKSLAVYESSRDMIELGAHKPGINQELDSAIRAKPLIDDILSQSTSMKVVRSLCIDKLKSVVSEVRQ